MGIWYEIYGRWSDFLTLQGVGIWEIEASAVERLCKAIKYWKKIDCEITQNICALFAKLRQGGGVRQFSSCLTETKYEHILFRTVPYAQTLS